METIPRMVQVGVEERGELDGNKVVPSLGDRSFLSSFLGQFLGSRFVMLEMSFMPVDLEVERKYGVLID